MMRQRGLGLKDFLKQLEEKKHYVKANQWKEATGKEAMTEKRIDWEKWQEKSKQVGWRTVQQSKPQAAMVQITKQGVLYT